jgi:hypothetical protein
MEVFRNLLYLSISLFFVRVTLKNWVLVQFDVTRHRGLSAPREWHEYVRSLAFGSML